jgi:hypothetical protein
MSLNSVLWTRSSTLGERSRNTQGEQTNTDDEHNAENDHNACFASSPVLSLNKEAVDGIAGFEGCEGCHFLDYRTKLVGMYLLVLGIW